MGKKSSFFSAVKKAITCESKPNQTKTNRKRRGCFRRQRSVNLGAKSVKHEASTAEKAVVLQATPPPPTEEVKLLEAESEQNRHAYSVAIVTAMAAEAAVAAANAAAEVVRLRASTYTSGKTKQEIASIKIQAAFRGYMARRVLRALRGLVRLKSVVRGKSVERQAAASLRRMQTMTRLQSEIRVRRIRLLEENPSVQRQIVQMLDSDRAQSTTFKGENWDESMRSKEQIEADIHYRKQASMRRERALAYSYSHQRLKNPSNPMNEKFVETNNPGWGWSWLERWMATRPWEKGDAVESADAPGLRGDTKTQSASTVLGGSLPSLPPSRQSPSTPKSRAGGRVRPQSPRGGMCTDDDSKSLTSTQSEQCRRRSYAGSSVRDDESLASSPAVPGYMAYTESARARSRVPSPNGSETDGYAKKRLSYSGSPARSKMHSTPTRTWS